MVIGILIPFLLSILFVGKQDTKQPIVTKSFIRGAQVQRDALGMRQLEPVVVEHPLSILSDEQMESRAQEAVPQVKKILLKR